jgi:tetratricopeptide (TPR) repeat protein
MKTRSTIAAAALAGLVVCAAAATTPFASLLRAHKFAEVDRIASARLASDPTDPDALIAKADAIVALDPDGRTDEAIRLSEQCIAAHPQHSGCYLAAGNALGAKARHAGPMAAMGYATKIRGDFLEAVKLDPRNTDARFALLDYYMQAPKLVGGGKARAQALAAQTEAVNPAAARLMQAQLALAKKNYAAAQATLLAVQPGGDEMVADRQRELLVALGQRYQADGKRADSQRIFHIVQQRFPDRDAAQ